MLVEVVMTERRDGHHSNNSETSETSTGYRALHCRSGPVGRSRVTSCGSCSFTRKIGAHQSRLKPSMMNWTARSFSTLKPRSVQTAIVLVMSDCGSCSVFRM